jgi:hypothetical protein
MADLLWIIQWLCTGIQCFVLQGSCCLCLQLVMWVWRLQFSLKYLWLPDCMVSLMCGDQRITRHIFFWLLSINKDSVMTVIDEVGYSMFCAHSVPHTCARARAHTHTHTHTHRQEKQSLVIFHTGTTMKAMASHHRMPWGMKLESTILNQNSSRIWWNGTL